MQTEPLKNRLRKTIQHSCCKTGGYIKDDVLFAEKEEISLDPFLNLFEKLQTSPLFTRLPPLFNTNENFPIRDMYVELAVAKSQGFADPLRLTRGLSLAEEQEERYKQHRSKRLNIEQCVENPQHQHIVILGDPGSGKTSLLKYLCQHIAQGQSKRWIIPLFIPLRQYWSDKQGGGSSLKWADKQTGDTSFTLLRFIAAQLQNQVYGHGSSMLLGLSKKSDMYNKAMSEVIAIEKVLLQLASSKQNHVLFLLDGLDEVASQPEAINSISEDIRYLGANFSWVLSSRYTGFYSGLGEDICYEMVSLHKQGIEELVTNWFTHSAPQSRAEKSQLILSQIQDNPRLQDMARNPFLLTLLCYVQNYNKQQLLPVQRSDIYHEIIKLIRQQLRHIKKDKQLLGKPELDYLSRFCHYLYTSAKDSPLQLFEHDHWEACAYPDAAPNFDKHFLPSRLLNSWRQNGDFHFVHLTFQEYFIALHLSSQPAEQVKEQLYNPQWKMVYRFLAGLYSKLQNKADYQNLIYSLLNPVDKMGLLYIEAAWFLIEAGIENSITILDYDLRDKLWDIWCQGYSYAGKSAGEALAILSPSYVIRMIIELSMDKENHSLAKRSIGLLAYVNGIDANNLLLELLQSKGKEFNTEVISAIAEKNTPDIRSQCIDLFKQDSPRFFSNLCQLAKLSRHKVFLPHLLAYIEEKPIDLNKYSALFQALTAIAQPETDYLLLTLIQRFPVDELSDEIIEAFISLNTELVTIWLHETLPLINTETTKRKIIFHAIRFGLLSSDETIKAIQSHNLVSQHKFISAVYEQKELGMQPAMLVISAIAEVAFSNSDNSSRAFTILINIDQKNVELNKRSAYKIEYRHFLNSKDHEKVMGAISVLAENQDIQSFKTILNFAKSSNATGIRIEAITSLPYYHTIYPSEVSATLHEIYQSEKTRGAMNAYYASEALGSLAQINIKELTPYYDDKEAQDIITRFCSTEGILLFDDFFIDRYGIKHTLKKEEELHPSARIDHSVAAIEQLIKLRSVCLFLLKNHYAKKSGSNRLAPPPLFNKNSNTYEPIDSIDIKTGNDFLKGDKLTEKASTRLMAWMQSKFPWTFNE